MEDDFLDDVPPAGATSSRHALLTAALLHLMSQYTLSGARSGPAPAGDEGERPCVKLACVIQRHLDALARLPEAEPVLRATCEQLSVRWDDLVACRLPPTLRPKPREPFLVRLLGPQGRVRAEGRATV